MPKPHQILIVDDQKGFSRLLRSALDMLVHNIVVSEAPSGEEAILEASQTKIDLLIADYRLPGINGVQLVKKYRVLNPDGKVIVITGVPDPVLIKQINEASPDAFFLKPVPMSDFLEAVERLLGLASTIIHPEDPRKPLVSSEPELPSLGDLLVGLRKKIDSQAVLLFNDAGRVIALAGEPPAATNSASLISAMLSLFNNGQRAASLVDQNASHLHLFSGHDLDGIFLPVDASHGMLLVGKGLTLTLVLPARLDILFAARLEIKDALQRLLSGVALPEIEPSQPFTEPIVESDPAQVVEESSADMDELPGDFLDMFDQSSRQADDANSFWDTAVEKGTTFTEPDKLTYDQALRLGLTPDSAQ